MYYAVVYKTGGDFELDDVRKLRDNVKRFHPELIFTCFSDDEAAKRYCDKYIPLTENYKGWWSIIEAFKLHGKVIFTGLDTVIVDKIDPLIDAVQSLTTNQFIMLRPFNPMNTGWASGIMAWHGNYEWIHDNFCYDKDADYHVMEQSYTTYQLKKKNVWVIPAQYRMEGIYSYRHQCRAKLPNKARIVLFHGNPRPKNADAEWLKGYYDI